MNIDPVEAAMIGPFILGDSQAIHSFEEVTQIGFKSDHFQNRSFKKAWEQISYMLNEGIYTPEKFLSFLMQSNDVSHDVVQRGLWINEVSKSGISINMGVHAVDLIEKYLRNEAQIAMGSLKSEKGSEILNELESKITELRSRGVLVQKDEKLEACKELIEEIHGCINGTSKLRSSGVPVWDQCLGGLPDSKLIIVAGRPGCSKTSINEQIIDELVRNGTPTLYIQQELAKPDAIGRLACRKANVDWWKVEQKKILKNEADRLEASVKEYESLPLYLRQLSPCNAETVGPIIRYYAKHHGVKHVVVDYITLIDPPKGVARWVAIGDLTRTMKRAANDTGCTVMGIAQIGRDQEKRGEDNAKPTLSDLRESGNIEQDADVVLALWRNKDDDNTPQYPIHWSILKNRNGGRGTTSVLFDGPKMKFLGEIEPEEEVVLQTANGKQENWYEK